tara:strand:- start:539 stop:796 length:258 start_codon:yes stop_codon:yes gene_type:complete
MSEMERQYKQDSRRELMMMIKTNGLVEGDLVGVDGNAFSIMGYTYKQLTRGGWSRTDANRVICIAKLSDYNHLLATCDSVLRGEE